MRAWIAVVAVAAVLAVVSAIAFVVVSAALDNAVAAVPHAYASYWNSVGRQFRQAERGAGP